MSSPGTTKSGDAWVFEYSTETSVPRDAIWQTWEHFAARGEWDDLVWARLDGPLAPGTTGSWKPHAVPAMRVLIEEVEPSTCMVLTATHTERIAVLRYVHRLDPGSNGTTLVTHRLELRGPLRAVIRRLVLRPMAKRLPEATEKVIELAGEQTTPPNDPRSGQDDGR